MSADEKPGAFVHRILREGKAERQPNLDMEHAKQSLRERTSDYWMRIGYASAWFVVVTLQLLLLDLLMVGVGLRWFAYEGWLFNAFLLGTFVEGLGIVWVITRNLFPNRDVLPVKAA